MHSVARFNIALATVIGRPKRAWYWTEYRVAQKSKPLPNDQKIVLDRIKTCEW